MLIEDLVVEEPYRNQGAGRALLHAAGKWGLKTGACRLQLLADQDNRQAMGFCQAQGLMTTKFVCLRRYL